MLDPLGPAQVAHMDQTVNSVFNLDESSKVGQVANAAFNSRANGIFFVQTFPRIRLKLLDAQRNAPLLRVHVQHHAINLVANVHQLGGMLHALGPRHLAHVYQAFDALLQLDESAVVSNAKNAAFYARADRIALSRIQPGIRRELLESQGDPQLVAIKLEHFYLDLVAHVNKVARMRQAAPRHISDVEQAIDSAQINKSAVVGQIFDRARHDGAFLEVLQGLLPLGCSFFFQDDLA